MGNISKNNVFKLIGYLVAGGIFGAIVVLGIRFIDKAGYISQLGNIKEFMVYNNIYIFPLLFLVFFLPIFFIGKRGKKELNKASDLPDTLYDEYVNEAEKKIDIALSLNNTFMVINILFLGMSFDANVQHVFIVLVLFLFNVISISLYEISTIRFIQKNDNRLKGDPVSFRFRKDFFESCDEAEKQKILKTSYHSLNLARGVSLGLLVTTILGQMVLNTGIFAIFISGCMLLTITAGYSYYAIFKE